jgi:hypothetical protein
MNPLEKEVLKGYTDKARKETAKEIFEIIERLSPVCAVLNDCNTPFIQELTECRSYKALKQKYGVKL